MSLLLKYEEFMKGHFKTYSQNSMTESVKPPVLAFEYMESVSLFKVPDTEQLSFEFQLFWQ